MTTHPYAMTHQEYNWHLSRTLHNLSQGVPMQPTTAAMRNTQLGDRDCPPPPPTAIRVETLRDVVCECLAHFSAADANVTVIEGKLFGFTPKACDSEKQAEEPPVSVLLDRLRHALREHAQHTESLLNRL